MRTSFHSAAFAAALLLCAAHSFAQLSYSNATRTVSAVGGDGSGGQAFSTTNFLPWNQSATRAWTTGGISISQNSALNPFGFNNIITSLATATTLAEAGLGTSTFRITFSALRPFDFEGVASTSGNGDLGSTSSVTLHNNTINSNVWSGTGPRLLNLPNANYTFTQSVAITRGDLGASSSFSIFEGNDRCPFAFPCVAGQPGGTYSGNTSRARSEGIVPTNCGTGTAPDVYYTYTAPRSGAITFNTCGSSYNTTLSIYLTFNCTLVGTQVACSDDATTGICAGTNRSEVTVLAAAGQTFLIRIGGFQGATGAYTLNVGPTNGTCAGAIPLLTGAKSFDNRIIDFAANLGGTCSANTNAFGSLWYTFTAPANGAISVDTCDSSFNTVLAVFPSQRCGDSTTPSLACNDDNCGVQSRITGIPVLRNSTYYILLGSISNSSRGTGSLNLRFVACPADLNGDGVLDFFDYLDFIDAFIANNLNADLNADGIVDFFDYLDFLDAFTAGC